MKLQPSFQVLSDKFSVTMIGKPKLKGISQSLERSQPSWVLIPATIGATANAMISNTTAIPERLKLSLRAALDTRDDDKISWQKKVQEQL